MKLIVGLGHPGKEYESTRHNIGFYILDEYLGDVKWKESHKSLICEKNIDGEKILFVKPQTYMNNSGQAVGELISYYKLSADDILVIQDDITIQLGKHRIKYDSTDGGHNGIKSIISNLGTDKFLRLKIGLAKENDTDTISYVLGKLSKKEIESVRSNMQSYFDIIDTFISYGREKVMMM